MIQAMRRILSALSLIALFALASCVKAVKEDPADRFVGTYSFTDSYYVTWGSASSSFNDSGMFVITKLGPSTIKISNPWNTTATVMANQLNIEPVTQGDNSGYINYTFTSASIAGDMLSISYQGMGSLKHTDGRSYPYMSQGRITATKQN